MSEEFDIWFRRMRRFMEEFDRMIEDMMREMWEPERRGKMPRRGYYYGFSITIGPNGIPRVREWGNIRPGIRPRIMEAVEPFTDVIEEPDKINFIPYRS